MLLSHALEHIPYSDVLGTLQRIRSWMRPGARITVEVPDMREIAPAVDDPLWLLFVYGVQNHPGEFHRAGFTETTLQLLLEAAGFADVRIRKFISEDEVRLRMPCLEAVARA